MLHHGVWLCFPFAVRTLTCFTELLSLLGSARTSHQQPAAQCHSHRFCLVTACLNLVRAPCSGSDDTECIASLHWSTLADACANDTVPDRVAACRVSIAPLACRAASCIAGQWHVFTPTCRGCCHQVNQHKLKTQRSLQCMMLRFKLSIGSRPVPCLAAGQSHDAAVPGLARCALHAPAAMCQHVSHPDTFRSESHAP